MNDDLLPVLIFVAAVLYSAVGHGGGSGYLAAMALCGVAPAVMKPTALVLNVLVATIGTVQFARAGCFSWRLFLPFVILSIPAAFLGGSLTISGVLYKRILGTVLLFAACRLAIAPRAPADASTEPESLTPPWLAVAVVSGAAIGLLSGMIGVGGGIFLTPLLLFTGMASPRRAAGVSVAFILANSIAGLLGYLTTAASVPSVIPYWAAAALAGGIIGSQLGSQRLGNMSIRRLLAVVIAIAAAKLLMT